MLAFIMQSDSTVVDRTGIAGPLIDHFWPVLVTFLTSLTVKGVAMVSEAFRNTSEPVKWAALYVFSLLYNVLARWLGLAEVDPTTATWASAAAIAAAQTAAAALIYKFGQHRVLEVS